MFPDMYVLESVVDMYMCLAKEKFIRVSRVGLGCCYRCWGNDMTA